MARYPKTLGACVDRLYRERQRRLEYQRGVEGKLKELKGAETKLEDHILETFKKDRLEGGKGKLANVAITRKVVPNVDDHSVFLDHVFKTKEYDLLTQAVRQSAIRERWDAGEVVPGIKKFVKVGLSLTKRSR